MPMYIFSPNLLVQCMVELQHFCGESSLSIKKLMLNFCLKLHIGQPFLYSPLEILKAADPCWLCLGIHLS